MSIFLLSHEKRAPQCEKRGGFPGESEKQGVCGVTISSTGRRVTIGALVPCFLIISFFSISAWADEYFQYLPSSLETETTPPGEDGILVKKITIRRGDTLSNLSRHYAGRGYYYPQILLFNKISDPNRIFAGRELLVPVSSPVSRRKPAHTPPKMTRDSNLRDAIRDPSGPKSREYEKRPSRAEQRLYKQAVALMDRGNYLRALNGFSLFLKKYPDSPLSPDAHLHRADCYLRLSGSQGSEPVSP
jgi:LysM repeat protein